jgi:hypothetical protein
MYKLNNNIYGKKYWWKKKEKVVKYIKFEKNKNIKF